MLAELYKIHLFVYVSVQNEFPLNSRVRNMRNKAEIFTYDINAPLCNIIVYKQTRAHL